MSDSLLNRTQVRAFTFDAIRRKRAGLVNKMTRISDDYYLKIESRLRGRIIADAQAADGGEIKTLRPKVPPSRSPEYDWLLNQSNVRAYALKAMGGTSLTQIAGDYADACDLYLRSVIDIYIESMPSAGKTIN